MATINLYSALPSRFGWLNRASLDLYPGFCEHFSKTPGGILQLKAPSFSFHPFTSALWTSLPHSRSFQPPPDWLIML